MKLSDYIKMVLLEMPASPLGYDEYVFTVHLNSHGEVAEDSPNTVTFTVVKGK